MVMARLIFKCIRIQYNGESNTKKRSKQTGLKMLQIPRLDFTAFVLCIMLCYAVNDR